jgi:hypothetical protein
MLSSNHRAEHHKDQQYKDLFYQMNSKDQQYKDLFHQMNSEVSGMAST